MIKKTLVMKYLDQKKIPYEAFEYEVTHHLTGEEIADVLNENAKEVFKTIVCDDYNKHYYVFIIPVLEQLDLKKCAKIVGAKKLELLPLKELHDITGYYRGGCSPIGMKRKYLTHIDSNVDKFEFIYISAGEVGKQIKIDPKQLIALEKIKVAELI
ncbi:conserved hypothetical protein [Alteracholeplasma palmae J233]|uniref:Cys-tRNA(Pro)/Cys-tRNA(Cys) deacylase n=1 Tax=Alteracholeplasma palmae (strain ATCC 49389 / J233) TaxID=1318466 RepID=U4KK89_ALTPJ|nr:Cys-tRNA(Pro) deacylase [Alteracholeplasma palmae]CCV63967.1 conserved hypothetical protein [Alteracholeplasma palmae J233]